MKSLILMRAFLLWGFDWIPGSVSEPQIMEFRHGQEVTLLCSNISTTTTQTEWFRLVNGTHPSCIASMYDPSGGMKLCDGFESKKFEMTSNISNIFLTIHGVDSSDSGLYFCGFYVMGKTVLKVAAYLNVQGLVEAGDKPKVNTDKESGELKHLERGILVVLSLLLTAAIIVLAFRIRKLQKAVTEETGPEVNENRGSDHLTYSAVTFKDKPRTKRMLPPESLLEANVVYATTR